LGSRIREPDPWVKKAKDPRSRSATLFGRYLKLLLAKTMHVDQNNFVEMSDIGPVRKKLIEGVIFNT
jgi:hypothetical protein